MKKSEKLKFDLVDNFEQTNIKDTIVGFSNNFITIDELHEQSIDRIEDLSHGTSHKKGKIYYNSNPEVGEYVGWVNSKEGIYAPYWNSRVKHEVGDLITPSHRNGHVYRCISAGMTAYSEPLFPTVEGSTAFDNHKVQEWISEHNYDIGDLVYSTLDESVYYECITDGLSDLTEPSWSADVGTSVSDGTVVWLVHKTVEWQEVGRACQFFPFGKIEMT